MVGLKKYFAEFLGTFVLVLFGCGTAVLSGADLVATSLAFGLSIVCMAYAIGPVSGCHVNPAVSLAMAINKRLSWKDFAFYVLAQFAGAIAGAGLLYGFLALSGIGDATITALGQNGFEANSAIELSMGGAVLVEIVLTFVFVLTILGVTGKNGGGKKAGLVIGLTLALIHLLGIRLTGTSVNPARSFGPAIILLGDAIKQVWVFIVAPFVGGALAAFAGKFLLSTEKDLSA